MGLSPCAASGSTEPAQGHRREADYDKGDASGQDVAHMVASLAGAGFFGIGFDMVADFARGHGFSPLPGRSVLGSAPMNIILAAFTLFHVAVGLGTLEAGLRLLTAQERAHWRSKAALLVAQLLCWVYPLLAVVCASWAWRVFATGQAHALPLMLAPVLWLLVMGLVFAIVDFAEDGIIGNARRND